ncbi:MAG TPA: RimK/LysX family protein [Cyclobacteriaceae bacterium]|nr:RimK/LysX family protein [Cyclobacteriaceae bacterium]
MQTLGRSDMLDLPDLGIENVPVKIDTGAYTSCIHCISAKEISNLGLEVVISLEDHNHHFEQRSFLFKDFSTRLIKNSSGVTEERYIIKTAVVIYAEKYQTEFSLNPRGNMRFPVLLGRRILRKRFVIDVAKKNLSYKHKIKKQ